MAHGVVKKGERLACPVDDSGQFTEEVTDFAGQHVKVRHMSETFGPVNDAVHDIRMLTRTS